MSLQLTAFSASTSSIMAGLAAAKKEMSSRFLATVGIAPMAATGFRATARVASRPSNIVGVGIDEKHVAGIPTGVQSIKFLVRSKVVFCPSRIWTTAGVGLF